MISDNCQNYMLLLSAVAERVLSMPIKNDNIYLYTRCHFRNRPGFCVFPFAKTDRFPVRQNKCFHPAKRLFFSPAVPAGITHSLHCKVVCQRGTLWNPLFCLCPRQNPKRNRVSVRREYGSFLPPSQSQTNMIA